MTSNVSRKELSTATAAPNSTALAVAQQTVAHLWNAAHLVVAASPLSSIYGSKMRELAARHNVGTLRSHKAFEWTLVCLQKQAT